MGGGRYNVGGKKGDALSVRHPHTLQPLPRSLDSKSSAAHSAESGQVRSRRLYLGACCVDIAASADGVGGVGGVRIGGTTYRTGRGHAEQRVTTSVLERADNSGTAPSCEVWVITGNLARGSSFRLQTAGWLSSRQSAAENHRLASAVSKQRKGTAHHRFNYRPVKATLALLSLCLWVAQRPSRLTASPALHYGFWAMQEMHNGAHHLGYGSGGLWGCEMSRIDNRLTYSGKAVSPTHRPRSSSHEHYFPATATNFC
jgi:hypothetical protein